jgi:IclR family acetate operon transcriptional repressor
MPRSISKYRSLVATLPSVKSPGDAQDGSQSKDVPRGTLGTVHNAVSLLRLLAEGPTYHQLTDLAGRSGLAVPTVHRLLRSLVAAGFVEQETASSRYGLGPELVRLAHAYLGRLPVATALSPYLVEVRNTTGATIMVSLLVRGTVVYVDRIDGTDAEAIYREAHTVDHAFETAAGRVLASNADTAGWAAVLATAPPELVAVAREHREAWRTAPYVALEPNHQHERGEVAVPVLNGDGRVVAALSAAARRGAFDPEALAVELQRAAKAASRTVGNV